MDIDVAGNVECSMEHVNMPATSIGMQWGNALICLRPNSSLKIASGLVLLHCCALLWLSLHSTTTCPAAVQSQEPEWRAWHKQMDALTKLVHLTAQVFNFENIRNVSLRSVVQTKAQQTILFFFAEFFGSWEYIYCVPDSSVFRLYGLWDYLHPHY